MGIWLNFRHRKRKKELLTVHLHRCKGLRGDVRMVEGRPVLEVTCRLHGGLDMIHMDTGDAR